MLKYISTSSVVERILLVGMIREGFPKEIKFEIDFQPQKTTGTLKRRAEEKMEARQVGAESTSLCTWVKHLPNLLRNKANSQKHPSIYEDRRPKSTEDTENTEGKGIASGQKRSLGPDWCGHCGKQYGISSEN